MNYVSISHILTSSNQCGGLEMAPHENKWSPLDGAHE